MPSSRREPLRIPRKHWALPDVAQSEEEHDDTFEADAPWGKEGGVGVGVGGKDGGGKEGGKEGGVRESVMA